MKNFSSGPARRFVAAALLIAIVVLLFKLTARQTDPYHALPPQSAFVFEFQGLEKCLLLKNATTDPLWAGILNTDAFRNAWQDAATARALFAHDPALAEAFARGTLIDGISLNRTDSLHGLLVLDAEKNLDISNLLKNSELAKKVFPAIFHGNTIYDVYLPDKRRMVVASVGHLLLFSKYSYLVEDALSQIGETRSWWTNRHLADKMNPGAPFHLYCRPEMLTLRYSDSMLPAWKSVPEVISSNLKWVGLSWNGLSTGALAETEGFLGTLNRWGKTGSGEIFSVLPDNTALAARISFDRPGLFFNKIKSSEGSDFEEFVLPWMGEEAAWCITEPFSQGMRDDQFIVFAAQDSLSARDHLRDYGRQRGLLHFEEYQTFDVYEFASPAILSPLFKDGVGFRRLCCAMIGRYVVFSNSLATVELMIDKYIIHQTLPNNTDYLQLRQKNGSPPGCAEVLVNTAFLPVLLRNLIDPDREAPQSFDLQSFERAGFIGADLLPASGGVLEMRVAAQPHTEQQASTGILWKTPLADIAATGPFVIESTFEGGETAVLVQDTRLQLYGLDAGGAIIWKRPLESRILSTVKGIDFRNNQKICYIFNTADRIWLLDDQGRDVEGFPLELLSPATNGITVVDFDNSLRFNYFIACQNGNIYGYDQFGRPLPGWNPQGGMGRVVQPVLHFQRDHKDYLAVINQTGKLFAFGRNGAERFPAVQLDGAGFGPLQTDAGSKSPRIVCANGSGKIFICNTDGSVFSLLPLKSGKQRTHFVFAPLTGDVRYDYALIRANQLTVSGYAGTAVRNFFTRQLPLSPDTVFAVSNNSLGVLNRAKRQIYLAEGNGQGHADFPLPGTTAFTVSQSFRKNAGRVLVVGDGINVCAYKIK